MDQLEQRMKKFAANHADRHNIEFQDTKIFSYRIVGSQLETRVKEKNLKLMFSRVRSGNPRKSDMRTLQLIDTLLCEFQY